MLGSAVINYYSNKQQQKSAEKAAEGATDLSKEQMASNTIMATAGYNEIMDSKNEASQYLKGNQSMADAIIKQTGMSQEQAIKAANDMAQDSLKSGASNATDTLQNYGSQIDQYYKNAGYDAKNAYGIAQDEQLAASENANKESGKSIQQGYGQAENELSNTQRNIKDQMGSTLSPKPTKPYKALMAKHRIK